MLQPGPLGGHRPGPSAGLSGLVGVGMPAGYAQRPRLVHQPQPNDNPATINGPGIENARPCERDGSDPARVRLVYAARCGPGYTAVRRLLGARSLAWFALPGHRLHRRRRPAEICPANSNLEYKAESDYGRGPRHWVMDLNFLLRCTFSLAIVGALFRATHPDGYSPGCSRDVPAGAARDPQCSAAAGAWPGWQIRGLI